VDSDDKDSGGVLGRRRSLRILAAGLTATELVVLGACTDSSAPASGGGRAEDCNAQIDEASKTIRTSLQYKPKTDTPDTV